MSQPNNLIADPAKIAEPRAVDLNNKINENVGSIIASNLLSHLWPDDSETTDISENLHRHISVGHAAVNLQMGKVSIGV